MLAYFPSYKITARLISFLSPLVIFFLVFLITGYNVLTSGIIGGVAYLVLMLVLLYVTGVICARRADKKSDALVALYNQQCDPGAFVEQGARVGKTAWEDVKINGTTDVAAWFLSPFALACLDADAEHGEADAEMMEREMLENIPEDAPAIDRAGILSYIEPLTLRLHGIDAALKMCCEAANILERENTDDAKNKMRYLQFEIPYLETLKRGNASEMLQKYEEVWQSSSVARRMRVLNAEAAAGIYGVAGERNKQVQALQFVTDHGNRLPSVTNAKRMLATLGG